MRLVLMFIFASCGICYKQEKVRHFLGIFHIKKNIHKKKLIFLSLSLKSSSFSSSRVSIERKIFNLIPCWRKNFYFISIKKNWLKDVMRKSLSKSCLKFISLSFLLFSLFPYFSLSFSTFLSLFLFLYILFYFFFSFFSFSADRFYFLFLFFHTIIVRWNIYISYIL